MVPLLVLVCTTGRPAGLLGPPWLLASAPAPPSPPTLGAQVLIWGQEGSRGKLKKCFQSA